MQPLLKPKYCGQEWLNMKPTAGGRICGECEKKIVDFTTFSNQQIREIQEEHGNTLCGMYSKKQLDNWGLPKRSSNNSIGKLVAASSLLALSTQTIELEAKPTQTLQEIVASQYLGNDSNKVATKYDSTVVASIEGTVFAVDSEGVKEPLLFAHVYLKKHKIAVTTDLEGRFYIDIRDYQYLEFTKDTLAVSYVGYAKVEKPLDSIPKGNTVIDVKLSEAIRMSVFYVNMPTKRQRVKNWFKRLFRSRKVRYD